MKTIKQKEIKKDKSKAEETKKWPKRLLK